jgi:HlyD family secretion protein
MKLQKHRTGVVQRRVRLGNMPLNCRRRRQVQRIAQEQESPAPNQPLIRIIDTSKLEIETIIPPTWLNWIRPGITFKFIGDETSQTLSAEVLRVGDNA